MRNNEMNNSCIVSDRVSDWTAVGQRKIPWDLERTPLMMTTDSTAGSDEWIDVYMYGKDSDLKGGAAVRFVSPVQYGIGYCANGWRDLPVQPTVEVDMIWTYAKTDTAFIITCNGVEVLNYLFADSPISTDCVSRWGGDVVEEIEFHDTDTASDFYRAGKGLNLILSTCNF